MRDRATCARSKDVSRIGPPQESRNLYPIRGGFAFCCCRRDVGTLLLHEHFDVTRTVMYREVKSASVFRELAHVMTGTHARVIKGARLKVKQTDMDVRDLLNESQALRVYSANELLALLTSSSRFDFISSRTHIR